MNNWHDYGILPLKGQLVANPGGIQQAEAWQVYPGHRPTLLYLPYLLKGEANPATFRAGLYQAGMFLIMVIGMQALFGYGYRGVIAALFLTLCPGYILNLNRIDTISYPAVLGISIMGIAGSILAKKEISRTQMGGIFLLVGAFLLTNWSAAFSLGILVPYLLVKNPQISRRLLAFLVPVGIIAVAVLFVSMSSRTHEGATGGSFWNSYLFGPAGYDGSGMNWSKALLRISVVNVVAWLPLVGLGAVFAKRYGFQRSHRFVAFLPLVAAIFTVLLMRNYHAHHPWGATSFIGLGLLLTLELLTSPGNGTEEKSPARNWCQVGIFMLAVIYCLIWMGTYQNNTKEITSLGRLIDHTERNSTIITSDAWVPKEFQGRDFSLMMDRKFVPLEEWKHDNLAIRAKTGAVYLISPSPEPTRGEPFAQSSLPSSLAGRYSEKMLNFYRSNISRRSAADRINFYPEYYLYKL